MIHRQVIGGILVALTAGAALAAPESTRVAEIERMLSERPQGIARPIDDRAAWAEIGKLPDYQQLIATANTLAAKPVPEQPDELYLQFSKTGERKAWERVADVRRTAICKMAVAECIVNKGTYLPKIQEYIAAVCAERTWVMPAHDGQLRNFRGEVTEIDLGASSFGASLATTAWLLGDRLDAPTRELIRENLEKRIIQPTYDIITGKAAPWWWMKATNNWNAVCYSGIILTALTCVPEQHKRAEFVAAAEANTTRYFLASFTHDGYCSEGLSYWNYGFGNYVVMAEFIRQNTGGQLDLLELPAAREPARFGAQIQIINDVSPAFADCPVKAKPAARTMWYLEKHLGLNFAGYDTYSAGNSDTNPVHDLLLRFSDDSKSAGTRPQAPYEMRSWFKDAGIYIGRPEEGAAAPFGVAAKGGNNAENHNHNDVGSYVVVMRDQPVLLDPGLEIYTARTFSKQRYESKLLNSFGHAVPMVAGTLQRTGAEAQGKLIKTEFTDAADTLTFDLTSCYVVKDLQKLTRTFIYSRQNGGSLSVTDEVTFSAPQNFGTALITLGEYQMADDDMVDVTYLDRKLRVQVTASGPVEYQPEVIHEKAPVTPKRMGINLKNQVMHGVITVMIKPG